MIIKIIRENTFKWLYYLYSFRHSPLSQIDLTYYLYQHSYLQSRCLARKEQRTFYELRTGHGVWKYFGWRPIAAVDGKSSIRCPSLSQDGWIEIWMSSCVFAKKIKKVSESNTDAMQRYFVWFPENWYKSISLKHLV